MEKFIKQIHGQDAYYKLSAKNSGETSLNLSNELLLFVAPDLEKGKEKTISFVLNREDYLSALGYIFNVSPLYISSSTSSARVDGDPNHFIKDFQSVCAFFGNEDRKTYTVNMIYREDGRIYLNSLEDKNSKFNIRHFLIEDNSSLVFEKEGDAIVVSLNSGNPSYLVREKSVNAFAKEVCFYFLRYDGFSKFIPFFSNSQAGYIQIENNDIKLQRFFSSNTSEPLKGKKWFDDIIEIGRNQYLLCKEWTERINTNNVPSLEMFESIIKNIYDNRFTFVKEDGYFILKDLQANIVNIESDKSKKSLICFNLPLQQIFYGAPGTGKSHTINEKTEGESVIRTTFHPDSDYSTFVGAYKPTMTNVRKSVIIGQDEKEVNPLANSSENEERITYRFVKQAFLKAYIRAWNKFVNSSMNSVNKPISFSTKWGEYTVSSINETNIGVNKTEIIEKQAVQNSWSSAWKGSGFDPNKITNNSIAKAICKWIVDNTENATIDSFGDGWNKFFDSAKNVINEYKAFSQSYTFVVTNGNVFVTAPQHPNKETIREAFDREEINSESTAAGLARRLKEIYPNVDFDEVWNNVSKLTVYENSFIPQYLVIEEINRGNCAQIFGDLFQLLDRKNGFSEYPIEADDDIRKTLIEENPDDGLSFHGLKFTQEQKEFINSNFKGQNIADKIINGNVLVLPPNLFVWATMNTSDQSLFPMDSAFKRRWEWVYVPIEQPEIGKDARKWKIKADDHWCYWWEFLQAINQKIEDVVNSEDKQLGYFFTKPTDGEFIDANTFVNKVIFYLWNDVFKDEECDCFVYKKSGDDWDVDDIILNDNTKLTFRKFISSRDKVDEKLVHWFINNLLKSEKIEKLDDDKQEVVNPGDIACMRP